MFGRKYSSAITRPALSYLGRAGEALDSLGASRELAGVESENRRQIGLKILYLLNLGRHDEAAESWNELMLENVAAAQEDGTNILVVLLEIAVLMEDRESASLLALGLASTANLSSIDIVLTCPARLLGAAALLLGDPEQARAHYHQGLEACAKIGFRPEIALTRLQLAELLLEHYPDERSEAMEHLDFAISEFRDMKMQPSLERALRHREILKA